MLSAGALAAMLVLALAPAGQRKLESILEEASAAREAGDWARTLELLEEAYAVSPQPELVNNIGRALEALGRYQDAVRTYQRVVDDPQADASLRALDAARIAALRAQLEVAEVVVVIGPPSKLWIDGNPVKLGTITLGRGAHIFELFEPASKDAYVRTQEMPLGVRSELERAALTDHSDHALLVFGMTSAFERVHVDGYALRSDPAQLHHLVVPAGVHTLEVTQRGQTRSAKLELRPGEQVSVHELFEEPAQPRLDPVSLARAELPLEPEPSSSLGPLLLAAGGAAALGVALALQISAASDRGTVEDAPTDARGVVVGLTEREAEELWSAANGKSTGAAVLVSVGAGAVVGAVIWFALE